MTTQAPLALHVMFQVEADAAWLSTTAVFEHADDAERKEEQVAALGARPTDCT